MARGIDNSRLTPFYEKEEVKSIGHRHTIDHDTSNTLEIKQILLKLTELIARRLRSKKLAGKTVHFYYRPAFHPRGVIAFLHLGGAFTGQEMQITIPYTNDGLELFKAVWEILQKIWFGESIRMVGVSISNLKPVTPQNISLLPETKQQEKIIKTLDKINDKYGEFTLQRGILLGSMKIMRKPNPFLSDRRLRI